MIGTDIIEELGEQRDQLNRTRDRVSKRYLNHSPLFLLLNKPIINYTSQMPRMNSLLLSFSSITTSIIHHITTSVGSHWREPEPQQENPARNVQKVRLALLQNTFYITRIISKCLSKNILNRASSFPVISDWWRTSCCYQSLSSWRWPSWGRWSTWSSFASRQRHIRLYRDSTSPLSSSWRSLVFVPVTKYWKLSWLWVSHWHVYVVILSAKLY